MNTRAAEPNFIGHPKGLFYLAFTEAWERFSYYGMTALVVLYMVNQLLLPGHFEHVGGFSGFRAAVESIVGPLSTQALASQIFGLYSGFVYFTPLLGGNRRSLDRATQRSRDRPFLYSAALGISFLYYWPTLLALVSRAAPAKVNATLMGLAFMSLFVSNNLIGWLGGFYEKMTPAQFWAMHAAIAAGGGLLVMLFGRYLSRVLHPGATCASQP